MVDKTFWAIGRGQFEIFNLPDSWQSKCALAKLSTSFNVLDEEPTKTGISVRHAFADFGCLSALSSSKC